MLEKATNIIFNPINIIETELVHSQAENWNIVWWSNNFYFFI